MASNRRVLLKSRPQGEPTAANFDIVDGPIPEPKDGEYLSRTVWLSLDPYMRGRMAETKGYAANVNLGDAMVGGTVGARGTGDGADRRRLCRRHADRSGRRRRARWR